MFFIKSKYTNYLSIYSQRTQSVKILLQTNFVAKLQTHFKFINFFFICFVFFQMELKSTMKIELTYYIFFYVYNHS